MKHLISIILLVSSLAGWAKEAPKYIVAAIPAELRDDAQAIFWKDASHFTILAKNRASHKVFRAVTILAPAASDLARVHIGYNNKISKVSSISAAVYDGNGALIKKLKPAEIMDHSDFEVVGYTDNRYKSFNISYGSYPYTVEYEFEIEYKYLFGMPDFYVQKGEKISVISSEYTYTYPKNLAPKFNVKHISQEPERTDLGNNIESVSWKFNGIKPVKFEPVGPPVSDIFGAVEAAPSIFDYEGYEGSTESWESFGLWIRSLNKGRDDLPEEAKETVRSLAAKYKTDEEKIRALYEYMQNRTRYVSIQLGIGGLQTFPASTVEKNGYGDCKALSNYMVSMLSVIGIRSHYVLINSGRGAEKLDVSFPSPQFDHVVVCVPMKKDTIWLECTSQTNPFGYMGSFTGGRKALAITETGAAIVHTPVYTETENLQFRTAIVNVDLSGNAAAKVKTSYSGLQYENNGLDDILVDSYENQKKWVQNNTEIPVFNVSSFSMTNIKKRIPSAIVSLDLQLNKLATVSGKRLFLTPNLMNKSSYVPEKVESRKTNVVLHTPYSDIDTVIYNIPDVIYPEFLPEPVKIKSRFGEYEASLKMDQGQVIYIRKITRKAGVFPPESYGELIDFHKAITRADNMKIVFLNKT